MSNLTANTLFSGVQNTVNPSPLVASTAQISANQIDVLNLSVLNNTTIGTTVIGKPAASVFKSPLPAAGIGSVAFFNLVDSNSNYIQLPLTSNTFFCGLMCYYNLFGPGAGGNWISNPGFFIGTQALGGSTMSPTINNNNNAFYPFIFPQNSSNVQVGQYYPYTGTFAGGSFVANTALFANTNQLYQVCSATSNTTNYLTAAVTDVLSWNSGTNLPVGDFSIYLSYITLY